MKQAVAVSLALVVLSNGLTLFTIAAGIDRQLVYIPWAIVLLAVALWWTRVGGGPSWTEIGLSGGEWKRSAIVGALCGLGVAAPLILFLAFPVVLAGPVQHREIQNLDLSGLLWRLGAELTVATALTEEILFRGILQALFKRSFGITLALVSTNLVFALWHIVINAMSVQQNVLALPLIPPFASQVVGYIGSLVAVGIGGLILSLLRERTHHLAGSIAMHWVAVAAMTISVYMR